MSRLRQLQIEWNALVPQAQAIGLRGVRPVALYPQGLHERIPHRQRRLEWLRRELGLGTQSAVIVQPTTPAEPVRVASRSFTFGAELEFLLPVGVSREALAARLSAAGVRTISESYNHAVRSTWKLTTDGSLGYATGAELVSPVLEGEHGLEELHLACKVLTDAGCRINKSCGFHVHVGARSEDVSFFKNLVRMYKNAEHLIDMMLAPSRRHNPFCNSIRLDNAALDSARTIDQVARAINQTPHNARSHGRYCKLNLQSFWQHGTVEFRQHQGTVDSVKATQWVRFCLRMAQAARSTTTTSLVDSHEALLAMLNADEPETSYIMGRVAYFRRAAATRRAA